MKGVNRPLDGELYLMGAPLNEIQGAAKKWRPLTDQLEFHAFDIAQEGPTFVARHKELSDLFYDDGLIEQTHLQIVNYEVVNKDTLVDLHNKYVQAGYEGLILRNLHSEYAFGERTTGIFKFKAFIGRGVYNRWGRGGQGRWCGTRCVTGCWEPSFVARPRG